MTEIPAEDTPLTQTPIALKGSSAIRTLLKTSRAYALLVILSIIWGVAFIAIKSVEGLLTPVNMTILRWFLASVGLLILVPFMGRTKTRFERKDIPRLALVSFANVVSYHLTLNYAESTISAGLAAFLVSLGPVFVVVLSWSFLGERQGKMVIPSVLLALAGVMILYQGSLFTSSGNVLFGTLEAVGSAASYAVFGVFSKPLVQKYGARPMTIWAGLLGTLMLLPLLSGSFIVQVESLSVQGWLAMLYLSILSTVIGYMLFYILVSRGAVSRLAIQLYLVPVVGVVGGAILLGEPVTVFTVIGGAAILSAVAFSTRRPAHT